MREARSDLVKLPPHDYVDFFLDAALPPVPSGMHGQGVYERTIIPDRFRDCHIDFMVRIPIPGGRHLLSGRTSRAVLLRLLADPEVAALYLAASWKELFESRFAHLGVVFEAEARRTSLRGTREYYRGKLATLVPGDELVAVYPPCVWGGDEVLNLVADDDVRSANAPRGPESDGLAANWRPAEYDYFLVDRFGPRIDGLSHLSLPFGVEWWPSVSFPGKERLLTEGSLWDAGALDRQTFTGLLLVPREINESHATEAQQKSLEVSRSRVKRLRTLLSVQEHISFDIIGEARWNKTQGDGWSLHSNRYPRFAYRTWYQSDEPWFVAASHDGLEHAVGTAFNPSTKRKDLHLQRSIDSLDLARTIEDRPLALVLMWAAIEALLATGKDGNITTNVALSLAGLEKDPEKRNHVFATAKRSYGMRSNIVHGFDIPLEMELQVTAYFTERRCEEVIRYAYRDTAEDLKGEALGAVLQRRALAGTVTTPTDKA